MKTNRKIQIAAIAVAIAVSTALSTQDSFAAARVTQNVRHSAVYVLKAKVASALLGIRSFLQGVDEQWESPNARTSSRK